MSGNSRKKERRRLKRKEKHLALRRTQSGSPYRRIGASGELVACYMNRDWQTQGMAGIYVLKQVPDGGHAMGAFLVDIWCVGLKDAWGRLDITRQEFDEDCVKRASAQTDLVRVDPSVVRRLVAGGIRFAHQNGFRLPPHYERWTAFLGGIGDWKSADLSDFGVKGGRLRYMGSLDDLKRRLIGCPLDQFLARKDVEYVVGPPPGVLGPSDEFSEDDESAEMDAFEDDETFDEDEEFDDEELTLSRAAADAAEQIAHRLQERALDLVRQWCFASGKVPHPRLADALDVMFAALMQVDAPADELFDDDLADAACQRMDRFLSFETPVDDMQLREALQQLTEFVNRFDSPEAFARAIGPPDLLDDLL